MPHTRRQTKISPEKLQQEPSNRATSSVNVSRDSPSNQTQSDNPLQATCSSRAQKQSQADELRRFIPQDSQYMQYYIQQYPHPGGDFSWQTQQSQQSYSSSSGSGDSQSSETSSSDENCSKRRKQDGNREMSQQHEDCNETSNSESGSSNTFEKHRDSANSGSDNSDEKTLLSPAKRDILERIVSNVVEKKLRSNAMVGYDEISWNQVASVIPGETEESCKKMWLELYPDHVFSNFIDGSIIVMKKIGMVSEVASSEADQKNHNFDPTTEPEVQWTDEEKAMVARMHRLLGHRWTLIAAKMNTGKNASQVKEYWTARVSEEQGKEKNKAK